MKRLGHLSGAMVLSSALVFQASWTHGQEEKPGKAPAKEAAKEADESDDLPKALGELPATVSGLAEAFAFQRELGSHDLAARYFMKLVAAAKAVDAAKRPAEITPLLTGESNQQFNRFDSLVREVAKIDKGRSERLKASVKEFEEMLAEVIRDNNSTDNLVKLAELVIEPSSYKQAVEGLNKLGGRGIALLLDVAMRTQEEGDRRIVTRALLELNANSIPALIGALDIPDSLWRQQVLAVLEARAEIGQDLGTVEPALWLVLADPKVGPSHKLFARRLLARLRKTEENRLPDAATRLAEMSDLFFRRKFPFSDPENLQIWRWSPKGLVAGRTDAATTALVRRDEAEEYWGEKCARGALTLRPTSALAKRTLLAFMLQSAAVPASAQLATARPDLMALLAGQEIGTLESMLREVLELNRGSMARHLLETLASRADAGASPIYTAALNHGDRRVRMAAIEALIRLPKPPSQYVAAQVVENLGRFLASSNMASGPKGRAILAMSSPAVRSEVARALEGAGRAVDTVDTGRELIRRIRATANIDLVVIDSNIPDPDLASVLAQVAADPAGSKLPVIVVPGATESSVSSISTRYQVLESRRAEQEESVRIYLRERDALIKAQAADRAELEASYSQFRRENKGKLTEDQQSNYNARVKDLRELHAREVEEMNSINMLGRHAEAEMARIGNVQKILRAERNDLVLVRQQRLERHLAGRDGVRVVGEGVAADAGLLRLELASWVQAGETALSDEEKKSLTIRSAIIIGRMARGEIRGYDIRSVAGSIDEASSRNDLPPEALLGLVASLAELPGGVAQARLATIASNAAAPLPVRESAADGLVKHARKYARLIPSEQVDRLRDARDKATEPVLKVLLSGALVHLGRPLEAKAAIDYKPAAPAAPMPPPAEAKEMDKAKEKDKE